MTTKGKKTIPLPPKVKRGDHPWTIDVPEWAESMANEELRWPINKRFKSKPGSSPELLLVDGRQFSPSLSFSIEVPKDFRVITEEDVAAGMSVHIKLAPCTYEQVISIHVEPVKPKNATLETLVRIAWKLRSLPSLDNPQSFEKADASGSLELADHQISKVLIDNLLFYQSFSQSKHDRSLSCELLGLDNGRLITIRASCCHTARMLERFDYAEGIIKSIRKIGKSK